MQEVGIYHNNNTCSLFILPLFCSSSKDYLLRMATMVGTRDNQNKDLVASELSDRGRREEWTIPRIGGRER